MIKRKLFGALAICILGLFLWPRVALVPDETPQTQNETNTSAPPSQGIVSANDDDPRGIYPRTDTRDAPSVNSPVAYARKPASKRDDPKIVTINNKQYPLRTYRPLLTPNDPYANQWWEGNAKLNSAWDIPRGSTETTLAIIDTGFALKHEDFAGRWSINAAESGATTSEQPSLLNCSARGLSLNASCNLVDDDLDTIVDNESGVIGYQNPSQLNCTDRGLTVSKECNRIDDDTNGFIDDATGWDFINYDNSVQAGEVNPTGSGTTHGTLVAGVAAATGNNGKGIAGADWGTKILPLQALDDDSYGDTRSVGRAILYAVERDVDVISISLGSDYPDDFILEAIQAAQAKGIPVVAASGNDGCDCMVYPARYPEVVAVGALDTNNQVASFSSWGQNIDIVAPGTQITSATWLNTNGTSAYASGVNGTSFATPMVGGTLTRLLSQQPSATAQQLIASLTENTGRVGINTIHDSRFGFGRLDAQKATLRMTNPVSPMQLYAFTPVQKGSYLTAGADLEPNGSYAVHSCEGGSTPATAIYELKKPGEHFFTISRSEQQRAVSMGFTSSLFTYQCLQQPHDTPAVIRNLNVFREFRNLDPPR